MEDPSVAERGEPARRRGGGARCRVALLRGGGSALDAVERAVRSLEDDEAFDAGHGAVLNAAGRVELDAVIMEGSGLRARAASPRSARSPTP